MAVAFRLTPVRFGCAFLVVGYPPWAFDSAGVRGGGGTQASRWCVWPFRGAALAWMPSRDACSAFNRPSLVAVVLGPARSEKRSHFDFKGVFTAILAWVLPVANGSWVCLPGVGVEARRARGCCCVRAHGALAKNLQKRRKGEEKEERKKEPKKERSKRRGK